MMKFYNWLVCKLFKRCHVYFPKEPFSFEKYCKDNPSAPHCRIYED